MGTEYNGIIDFNSLFFKSSGGGGLNYLGTWNAATNTPTLADGSGTAGDFYVVSVGATRNLGSGAQVFTAGDLVILNTALIWEDVPINVPIPVNNGLANYNSAVSYVVGNIIRGDGTNGKNGIIYLCNTNTTGAFVGADWYILAGVDPNSNWFGGSLIASDENGIGNTYSGVFAGTANVSGNYNVYAGFEAGGNATASYNTVIGPYQAANMLYGASYSTYLGGFNASGYSYVNNSVFISDGAGNVVYNANGAAQGPNNLFVGAGSGLNVTSGTANVILGGYAGTAIATGSNYLVLSDAQGNIVGWTGSGTSSTAFGENCMPLILGVSGVASTAYGSGALQSNISGGSNCAYGLNTLNGTTTGGSNTASGRNSLFTNISGSFNTGYGRNTLFLATGSGNTAIGYSAASALTTAANCTYLGQYTGSSGSDVTTSNTVVLSDGSANIVFRALGTTQSYQANTTWPLLDNSASNLTFTTVTSTYSRISNRIDFTCNFTYPIVSVDTNPASIKGLPVACNQIRTFTALCTGAVSNIAIVGYIAAGATTISIINAVTGMAVTNATLSLATITISGEYAS